MERYDYRRTIIDDIKEELKDGLWEKATNEYNCCTEDELAMFLDEELWTYDSVTGNASGSYFCNAWKAEEAICHNLDLLEEVAEEFGCPKDWRKYSAEYWDVAIRCYLLGQVIRQAIEEYAEENFGKEVK